MQFGARINFEICSKQTGLANVITPKDATKTYRPIGKRRTISNFLTLAGD